MTKKQVTVRFTSIKHVKNCIRNTTIYQNTIISSKSTNGNPAAVDYMTNGIHDIRFYNNTFKTDGKATVIRGEENPEGIFEGNNSMINWTPD